MATKISKMDKNASFHKINQADDKFATEPESDKDLITNVSYIVCADTHLYIS